VNAGIATANVWLTLGLAVAESLEVELSESSESETTYWPFKNKEQWQLALWALFPTPISRPLAERAIVAKFAVWAKPESCFESWGEFQRLVHSVEEKGGKWHCKVLHRVEKDPPWYPVEVRFWERNSLDILKELVVDIKVQAEHMKWAPEKVYNSKVERLYSEIWTRDWWWRKQVPFNNIAADFRKRSIASSMIMVATATIIPIILTSDKTLLSGNAKHKACPLYITIGNISNEVRFVPGKNAAKLIACYRRYHLLWCVI